MADASLFKTKDGRFPQSYLQAVDKLWAFVLVIEVYSGAASDLATALRRGLREIGPMILQLESLFHSNPRMGLMIAVRVMLFFQRSSGLYYRKARELAVGTPVAIPDFDKLADDLRMQAYDALPRVPDTWMEVLKVQVPGLFDDPPVPRLRGGGDDARTGAARQAVTNGRPSVALTTRWKKCKAASNDINRLADLRGKWQGTGEYCSPVDPVSGKDICLKYLLEGKCDSTCPRKATHKSFGADVTASCATFLDSCQVHRE